MCLFVVVGGCAFFLFLCVWLRACLCVFMGSSVCLCVGVCVCVIVRDGVSVRVCLCGLCVIVYVCLCMFVCFVC